MFREQLPIHNWKEILLNITVGKKPKFNTDELLFNIYIMDNLFMLQKNLRKNQYISIMDNLFTICHVFM